MIMNDECGKGRIIRSFQRTFPGGINKNHENLRRDGWLSGSETIPEFPEYVLGIAAAYSWRFLMLDIAEFLWRFPNESTIMHSRLFF